MRVQIGGAKITDAVVETLQMIHRDIVTMSTPPDVDDRANDLPAASL